MVLARANDLKSLFGGPSYDRILDLVNRAITALAGEPTPAAARRRYFTVNDQVAVQIATTPLAVTPEFVDAAITTAARAGVPPERMFLYSADERELWRAGFALRREGPGVRCYGASSEGYHGALSSLLNGDVTALVNVPCLAPHPQVGLAGALENFVNSVRAPRAQECLANAGALLPAISAEHAIRSRTRLHLMDCLRPAYDLSGEGGRPARWEYNGLLISADPVALDAVAAALLHAKRRQVKGAEWPLDPCPTYLEIAAGRYGLGACDLASIELLRVGPMQEALI